MYTPPTSWKVGVVFIGIHFLEYRTKQVNIFARRNAFLYIIRYK